MSKLPTTTLQRPYEEHPVNNRKHVARAGWQEIIVSSSWITMPLTVLTVAMVIYVFKNQVTSVDTRNAAFDTGEPLVPDDGAIYVNVNATMLMFLASWMSSVAPLLTGFAISLATFPITSRLLNDTRSTSRSGDLPTSFQLYLMLKIINGATWTGLLGLWDYHSNWKQRAHRQGTALKSLVRITICVVLLSAVIFGADTWLHIATTTVDLALPHPLSTQNAYYGFSALPACTRTNNSYYAIQSTNVSCTLNAHSDHYVFQDPTSVTLTLNNRSLSTSVLQIPDDHLSYLGVPPLAQNSRYDFTALTFAARTTCSPISRACNLNATKEGVTFHCNNDTFYANGTTALQLQDFDLQLSMYPNISDGGDPSQRQGVHNPFYVGGAVLTTLPTNSSLPTDRQILNAGSSISAIFQCEVTILDLEYTSVNGKVKVVSEKASNDSITNMFVSVMPSGFGQDVMKARVGAEVTLAQNAQDFADRFGMELNNLVLSTGAGSVQHMPVEFAQERRSTSVARVPKTPFYLLIASNVAFVSIGILLAIVASATPADARQAQYHLTTAGLVANMFDRGSARNQVSAVEQLFAEYHAPASAVKIGIDRTSRGGFELMPLYFAQ